MQITESTYFFESEFGRPRKDKYPLLEHTVGDLLGNPSLCESWGYFQVPTFEIVCMRFPLSGPVAAQEQSLHGLSFCGPAPTGSGPLLGSCLVNSEGSFTFVTPRSIPEHSRAESQRRSQVSCCAPSTRRATPWKGSTSSSRKSCVATATDEPTGQGATSTGSPSRSLPRNSTRSGASPPPRDKSKPTSDHAPHGPHSAATTRPPN